MSIIQLSQVQKHFDQLSVLKGVDLALDKGQVLGLFGHNGAGKTTIMKLILGLLKPDEGEVNVFGVDPTSSDFNHHRYQLGFLPENVSFYQQLTGREVLQFFARLKKVSVSRCDELLDQVGLQDAALRRVKTYSKGMKQRLGLAQALLTEPALLLLDEPTVGLDPVATQAFYQMVDELCNKGCSIILCSHVLPGVEKHIDKAAILSEGQLRAYGSLEQLRETANLKTQVLFTGCFDIAELSKKTDYVFNNVGDGSFSVAVKPEDKLKVMQYLMTQPGIRNLDTRPPGLEQLYRYFIDNESVDNVNKVTGASEFKFSNLNDKRAHNSGSQAFEREASTSYERANSDKQGVVK